MTGFVLHCLLFYGVSIIMIHEGGRGMLRLYNTLTQTIEPFEPIQKQQVSMYVCGPTVYGDIHLGNARPVIFFDVLRRYFEHLGYQVLHVSNITDVDDKIIEKAKATNRSELELADTYTKAFIEATHLLGSHLPTDMPKATAYVEAMIDYIAALIKKGYAYETASGVYFRVGKIKTYGTLSGQHLDALNEGVRINLDEDKEDPKDFSVWKKTTDGLHYDSPWGKGRPGWHTECAVMNRSIFKTMIDIHGGGTDLKFPHHENEMAQCLACDDHTLAKVWMHVGRLDIDQVKMSKSLGNIIYVKDLLEKVDPLAFRLLMITHHYRQPIHYHDELMVQFIKEYDKIKRAIQKAMLAIEMAGVSDDGVDQKRMNQFEKHMNDDINTPNVMTLVQELAKALNKAEDARQSAGLVNTITRILDILGLMPDIHVTADVIKRMRDWEQARTNKDYDAADRLRQHLISEGWL